jgi:hypothetical protein
MKTINFLYNITLDRDPKVVFFRLHTWDRADLQKALLSDVIVNSSTKSKIKRFTEWLKDMRKKEKVKFTTTKAGK